MKTIERHSLAFCQGLIEADATAADAAKAAAHSLAFCQGLIEAGSQCFWLSRFNCIPWHSAKALLKLDQIAKGV